MSIGINGFSELNKIWTSNIEKFRKEFKPILISSYTDSIYLTDKDIIKGRRLLFILETINNILPKDTYCKVGSGKRTLGINAKLKGSSRTSQHLFWEALDLHFYDLQGRITSKTRLRPILELIISTLGDEIQQGLLYTTFIHIGLSTSRTRVSLRRNINYG